MLGFCGNIRFLFSELTASEQGKNNYYNYKGHFVEVLGEKLEFTLIDGTSIYLFNETLQIINCSPYVDFLSSRAEMISDMGAQHGDSTLFSPKIDSCNRLIRSKLIHNNYIIIFFNIKRNSVANILIRLELADYERFCGDLLFQEGIVENSGGSTGKKSCKSVKFDSIGIDEVNLPKIDVQGGEVSVLILAGEMIMKLPPNLLFETKDLLSLLGICLVQEFRTPAAFEKYNNSVQNRFYSTRKIILDNGANGFA